MARNDNGFAMWLEGDVTVKTEFKTRHYTVTPLQIQGSRHPLTVHANGQIAIGCEIHSADWWLAHYRALGRRERYDAEEIEEYKLHILHCVAWLQIHGVERPSPVEPQHWTRIHSPTCFLGPRC